jgi:tetratricopeptide (TPR) repeat protein
VSSDRANPHAIDIDRLLQEIESPSAESPSSADSVSAESAPIASDDIDDVFAQLRKEAPGRLSMDAGEVEYKRALVLREAGDIDGCLAALEAAARDPKVCFAAASLLGRLHTERGALGQALEWFERAVLAPAPTPDDYHAVLYALGDGLEASGERARALAIWLELQSSAGSYRDVDARVERLAKTRAQE